MKGRAALWVWAGLAGLAALIVARARYSADLSAFLPRAPSTSEQLLVEQLRNGVASRLLIVAIGGADRATRARLSRSLAGALRADGQFAAVENGSVASERRDGAFLFAHRYVLSPAVTRQRFSVAGLHAAIARTLALIAAPGGVLAAPSLASDPTGEMLAVLGQLGGSRAPRRAAGVWVSRHGREALLLARTRAAGSDTDAQARAIEAIRTAFARACARAHARATLQLTGPGVFAVAARARIKHEVMRLSLLSGVLILTLLAFTYRSLAALGLALVPVASGALAGVAAVALRFGVVQGVTLGFGVTLIGEAVDYSIYLFIQSRTAAAGAGAGAGADWTRTAWPTVRLGMLTSVCGFAALLPSAFPGLAQLGLYSLAGVLAAGLTTRFVLPQLLPARFAVRDLRPLGARAGRLLRRGRAVRALLVCVALAAAAVLYVHRGHLWNRQLAALSPVPRSAEQLDARLRAALGAPGGRDLVVIRAPSRQAALRAAEQAGRALSELVNRGVLGGFESPALYLPSRSLQRRRQHSLPPPAVLRRRLRRALEGLPLTAASLAPFVRAVAVARSAPPVSRADLAGTSFAAAVDGLLVREGARWEALLPLRAPRRGRIDLARVRAGIAVHAPARATVLDLKRQANALYATYLAGAVRYSLAGLAAIALLLAVALRSPVRMLRVVLPLALAVLTVAAGLAACGVHLTLLHVIGMLLIVAVGSNYALFFERGSSDPPLTLASLLIANAATVLGFGVLAFSSVPVLRELGQTVAPGAWLALLFAGLLAREPSAPAPG
ncbi:MAG: MMPL family transporter [Steroidobacteraceae bacterium]